MNASSHDRDPGPPRAPLLVSDAKLSAALAAMRDAVFICDAKGNFVDFNDAFVNFHRFPSRAAVGRTLGEFAHLIEVRSLDGELVPLEQWAAPRALRGESGESIEVELRHVDSSERWYGSYSFAPIRDDRGVLLGTVVTARDVTEERRARAELAAERRRLRLLLESTDGALWNADLVDGTLSHDVIGWLDRYGIPAGQEPATLDAWLARIHPDDRVAVIGAMAQLESGPGHGVVVDFRVCDDQGNGRWMQSRAVVASRDAAGRVRQITGLALDTHERRLAEQALRDSEARLRLVIRAADLGVWDWNVETNVFSHNDRMATMLGYPPGELEKRERWLELIHPDDFESSHYDMREHLRGEHGALSSEVRLRRADGGWHWVMTRGQVVERDAYGRARRMIGIHVDIDAKKSAEAALAASETRLRAVVDNVPIGIILAGADGVPIFTNPAFRRILDIDERRALSLDWMEAIEDTDRAEMIRHQQALLAGTEHEFQLEFRYRRSSGDARIVRSRAAQVESPNADFVYIGLGEDVTAERARELEHERMRQQAQQSQKMEAVGQLAGGIAHDFNNILAAVVGFGELAMQRFVDDPRGKLAEYLATIITAGERGRDLVAKMLAFSRTSPSTHAGPIAVAPAVHEVAHMLSTIVPSTIHFEVVERAAVPPILMDAVDLHQVIVNLVVNARDAIDGHGEITIVIDAGVDGGRRCAACHAEVTGLPVCIAVRDSGSGIDTATLARIFEPFYTTKDVGKGTGMGLAVVHGLMHQAGGHVLVDSRPGHGTEFQLLFPAAAPDSTCGLTADPAAAASADVLTGRHVLVVDDEAPMRRLLGDLFAGEGMEVTLAHDGREALDLVRTRPHDFHLMFTDQTMPEMTGIEMLEALRASGATIPVVLMSGYSDDATRRAVVRCGAHFLAKPALPADALEAAALALRTRD